MNRDGTMKIADFGLSSTIKFGQKMGSACGTPSYMAPEMVRATGGMCRCCANDIFLLFGRPVVSVSKKIIRVIYIYIDIIRHLDGVSAFQSVLV